MKVKYKLKKTTAGTQYVQMDSALKNRILDECDTITTDMKQNYFIARIPDYGSVFFEPRKDLPKLGTGNDRSKGTGYNSIYSYIKGIVDNHRIGSPYNGGKKTSDFTDDNLKWISIVSAIMHSLDPDTYTEYEFVDEDELVNPADSLFGS